MMWVKNRLRQYGWFWGGLALFAAASVQAQDGGPRIGVINVQRLLQEAPQTQQAMAALQEEFAPRERELVAMQQALQEKQETYQRDASVMGEQERQTLERNIRDEGRDLQRANEELQEDATIRQNEVLNSLQGSLLEAVQAYARQASYDLVVAEFLYASVATDITDEVLATIREEFESRGAAR